MSSDKNSSKTISDKSPKRTHQTETHTLLPSISLLTILLKNITLFSVTKRTLLLLKIDKPKNFPPIIFLHPLIGDKRAL